MSSNIAKNILVTDAGKRQLPPTILYTTFVKSVGNQVGCLIDNGSTDDYILHKTAQKLRLQSQPVELSTEGFAGVVTQVHTKVYQVPVQRKDGNVELLSCYGADKITSDQTLPSDKSYKELCSKFKIDPREVRRPKKIDILISQRSSHLHPKPIKMINGMNLAEGPLGKCFGGSDKNLQFSPGKLVCPTSATPLINQQPVHAMAMKAVVRQAVYTTPLKTEK